MPRPSELYDKYEFKMILLPKSGYAKWYDPQWLDFGRHYNKQEKGQSISFILSLSFDSFFLASGYFFLPLATSTASFPL
jgi:hypothetical protein